MRAHLRYLTILVLGLAPLLIGCDTASPSSTVALRLEGTVRNATTGEAISDAEVRLYVLNEDISTTVLARTNVGADGRFTLIHALNDVADEDELNGACAVWNDGITAEPTLTVIAPGYVDGLLASESIACVETVQTIDFALPPR